MAMNGKTALIGHSGFVGSTLKRAETFEDNFNSSNISAIHGRTYDLVICAGVSAAKWIANRDPDGDRAGIKRLTDALEQVSAREFILISTIDVYPDPASRDDERAPIEASTNHVYGAHRYLLEKWVEEHFARTRVVRLPALFGTGLKKNALYDLLNDNRTENINPLSRFQWYPVRRLSMDIDRIRQADLTLVNLFGEALSMADVRDAFFPHAQLGPPTEPAPTYDLRTRYSEIFGGRAGYIIDATTTLGEMAHFVAEARRFVGRG